MLAFLGGLGSKALGGVQILCHPKIQMWWLMWREGTWEDTKLEGQNRKVSN